MRSYCFISINGLLFTSNQDKETESSFSKQKTIKNHMDGTIKTLTQKGFGFIAREGEVKDLFFHSKELSGVMFDELKVGDKVSFDLVDTEKGPAAKNVKRV